jgi:uncharacterized protein with PIN domain
MDRCNQCNEPCNKLFMHTVIYWNGETDIVYLCEKCYNAMIRLGL